MKVQVRQGVFETNSSSVHTLTMCSDSEYKKWENGELLYGKYSEVFITREEYEANQEKYDSDDDYKSYDDYLMIMIWKHMMNHIKHQEVKLFMHLDDMVMIVN